MAGIVRKFFKGGNSAKKPLSQREKHDFASTNNSDDDDYAELDLGPTTSSFTPSSHRPKPFVTPKLQHDETIDSDQSFEQPSLKRRRNGPIFDISNEESVYEHTQYQLLEWERQEEKHQERRKRKRVERHVEQENYVHSALEGIKLEMPSVADVEKLRKERDQYKREMEKYKKKYENLEKKYKNLEAKRQNPGYQPFMASGYNFFGGPSFQQPFFQPAAPLPPPTFLLSQQPSSSHHNVLAPSPMPSMNFCPPPSSSTPFLPSDPVFSMIGSSGPMAPRYPDPYNFPQDDEDTSLSDLSNSSKSDTSSDDLK
uniref:BZIP domain-containing protein n=1 Tax=Caenorhabditis tropicalis TaxID=1561998 RepID=A0A1I7T6M3_9PELO